VKSFGYLEDQEDKDAFWTEVNALNDSLKEKRDLRIEVPVSEIMYSEHNRILNYGYKFLESVYNLLEIGTFIDNHQRVSGFRGDYDLNEVFRYLVVDRVLYPASKREAASRLLNYYGCNSEFELPDVNRALDAFNDFFYELQVHVNKKVEETTGRWLDYSFYDVTNFYMEKDFADPDEEYIDRHGEKVTGSALGQKGVSKEHRLTPIIQMGLFLDSNGIPVCMDMFRGNMSDSDTLGENLSGFKKEYGIERTIVVADKGMNCLHNIDFLCSQGDGYVFSQILKGTKGKRYQAELFDPEGWDESEGGDYKCKLIEEEYQGNDIRVETREGKRVEIKTPVKRRRKVLLYWSKADADMAVRKREDKLARAEKSTKNNAYGIVHGKDRYVAEETVSRETGEVLDKKQVKKVQKVDHEKAEQDAKFDGYFAIITSEMDYDAAMIRNAYHGLWRIEESFRIMKSDFDARPLYVKNRAHVRAHFLICFISLIIVRVIQHCMGEKRLSAERIADTLKEANCLLERGGHVHLLDVGGRIKYREVFSKKLQKQVPTLAFCDKDQIALDYRMIQETFQTEFYYAYAKQEDFKRFLNAIALRKKA
jgi:transposase